MGMSFIAEVYHRGHFAGRATPMKVSQRGERVEPSGSFAAGEDGRIEMALKLHGRKSPQSDFHIQAIFPCTAPWVSVCATAAPARFFIANRETG